MNVAETIARRTPDWQALEHDVAWLRSTPRRRLDPARVADFARRYRAACSDLGLALERRFPSGTVEYLQQLVADAHTQLYRSESFSLVGWLRGLLIDVPRRTLADPCTWIAATLFTVAFGGAMLAAAARPGFAADLLGEDALAGFERMYADRPGVEPFAAARATMTGFYVLNNAGIGLRCFAGGILGGIGSLVILAFNALFLGAVFGHMLASPGRAVFTDFVTAHGPFELTAVVLSAAAGLRLGWSLLDTRGWGRLESLRRSAPEALGTAGLATVLFILAAFIEAYVSPTTLPYAAKAGVALASGGLIVGSCAALGLPWRRWFPGPLHGRRDAA